MWLHPRSPLAEPKPKGQLQQGQGSGHRLGDPWGFPLRSLLGSLTPILPAFQSLILKVWSVDQQYSKHYLGACWKFGIMDPIPDL